MERTDRWHLCECGEFSLPFPRGLPIVARLLVCPLFWDPRNSQWEYSWTSAIMSDRLQKYENIAWFRSVPSLFQHIWIPYWRSEIRYEASPNWATTMTQRSEICFIHGVCLSLKRRLSCFIAHNPVGGKRCISRCRNKTTLFRATHILVEEFTTIELMCLAYFP